MKKVVVVLAILALASFPLVHAQLSNPPNHIVGTQIGVNLPAAASALNQFWTIYNGASSSDCATGGGTTAVVCYSNGSSWTAVSGGGGSGTPGGSSTQVQYNNSSAFGGIADVTSDGTNLTVASGGTLTIASGATLTCAGGSTCPASGISPVYDTATSGQTGNLGAVTMVTPGANHDYLFTWTVELSVAGTSCTGSTTVQLNATFQSINGSGTTTENLGVLTLAANGVGTVGFIAEGSDNIIAKSGTAVTFSTTNYTLGAGCTSTNPTYIVYPTLVQLW